MGSMHVGLEDLPGGYDRTAAFYVERVRGEIGLIVTGGISPNPEGCGDWGGAMLTTEMEAKKHRIITDAVHAEGGAIVMQILHCGRYADHPAAVAPSALQSPISRYKPRALGPGEVHQTITDFIRCAVLAQRAGYDGVEVMGSEGYSINEFVAVGTNQRRDDWGGSFENRVRFPVEIVKGIRQAVGPDFIIIYRLSMLDLVEDGSSLEEVLSLGLAIEAAGATIISSGIGWHEARVPTIATCVPRGGFAWITRKIGDHVSLPVIASNRINTPEVAEQLIADGTCDLVSMARPLLADPLFARKAREGRSDEINTCIACNQACLDHTFSGQVTSCLVNPKACHETLLVSRPSAVPRRIAVVGAGPAGLSAAVTAAERGHRVTLFEADDAIGGQFNLAKRIPGKAEYQETIRYYSRQLALNNVDVRLGRRIEASDLIGRDFDDIVLATGVTPRWPEIEGIDHAKVASYVDILNGSVDPGHSVAVIGAGGIGFDTCTYLVCGEFEDDREPDRFLARWGVDRQYRARGGVTARLKPKSSRQVWLLQRRSGKLGAHLGRTTGWIYRDELRTEAVAMLADVVYRRIDDEGLHITVAGDEVVVPADTIVICAGQEPLRDLYDDLNGAGCRVHLIGGADVAMELDAKRAVRAGVELGLAL